jgi:hypothetical protein
MRRNLLWIFLLTAPLVSASSLGSFEATCSGAYCSGSYNGSTFTFFGPFPPALGIPYDPFIDFSIGTNGGSFTFGGNTCDYSVLLGGGNCYGEVSFGAIIWPRDDTGLSLGDVVSVKGKGTAEGWFCWDGGCPTGGPPPLFNNVEVNGTYQFTLTNPGTSSPFTWTAAQVSNVPEPATFVFASLGLAGVAVRSLRRRDD